MPHLDRGRRWQTSANLDPPRRNSDGRREKGRERPKARARAGHFVVATVVMEGTHIPYRLRPGRFAALLVAALLATVGAGTSGTAWTAEPLVFPGVGVSFEGQAGGCTLGFLFADRADQPDEEDRFFAITTGHCLIGGGSEATWAPGTGPAVTVSAPARTRIGEAVFAVNRIPQDLDVAVIELDDVPMDPAVCYFGGPTQVDALRRAGSETVSYVGQALPVQPRQGVADDLAANSAYFTGAASQGDSGGPVLSSAHSALGLIRGASIDSNHIGRGVMRVVRLDHMLPYVHEQTGLELELLTAPPTGKAWPTDNPEPWGCQLY